jgi:amidophosphoribosyltransferase
LNSWREECAVFGVWGDPEASRMTYLGLYAQQHRGQESTGIVSLDGGHGGHHIHKGLGLVGDVFQEENLLALKGHAAIGHNRYSTTGGNLLTNAQPLTANLMTGPVALAHNGNIVNSDPLREELISKGAIFQGTNDTEIILHLLSRHPKTNMVECLKDILPKIDGAFSLVILTRDGLIAARDRFGFRPLVLGERPLEDGVGHSTVIASETCAFDLIGAKLKREIEPGEIFWIDKTGAHSTRFGEPEKQTAHCVFEHVYFARPDSMVFGQSVYETRKESGRQLAREALAPDADIVIPVPDSGSPAALGYAEESGVPFEMGIIRNHYIGRTFIQPSQSIRSFGVKIKLNPQTHLLKGKNVVVIDDSLVRGTTSQKIINLVRQAGAKTVHFRIASPPTIGPCFYGVDTPSRTQLIASHKSVEEIRQFIGADTLAYLTVEGMRKAAGETEKKHYCTACFDGKYPTPLFGLDKTQAQKL